MMNLAIGRNAVVALNWLPEAKSASLRRTDHLIFAKIDSAEEALPTLRKNCLICEIKTRGPRMTPVEQGSLSCCAEYNFLAVICYGGDNHKMGNRCDIILYSGVQLYRVQLTFCLKMSDCII